MKKLIVIDIFGFFFRLFYALPPLRAADGTPTGMLTGLIKQIIKFRTAYEHDLIVIAADSPGKSFRNEIYPNYKANRSEAPEELKLQISMGLKWLEQMGFKTICKEGFEADDIIASLSQKALEQDIITHIVSSDKDMYQLIIDDKILIFDAVKNLFVDSAGCEAKFGVMPKDFTNFQAIIGDVSDNVPGVKGIGIKGASALINEYQTLENIYNSLDDIKTRNANLLTVSKEQAFVSRDLVTLRKDILNDVNLQDFDFPSNPLFAIQDELARLNFAGFATAKKASISYEKSKQDKPEITESKVQKQLSKIVFEAKLLDNKKDLLEVLKQLNSDTLVAFDTETTGLNNDAKIIGFSFCFDEIKAFYVPLAHNYLGVGQQIDLITAKIAIQKIFAAKVIGHNIKYDLHILKSNFDLELTAFADSMIMAWLANPSDRVGLDALSKKIFNHENISFKSLIGKGENFSHLELDKACVYAAEDALMTFKLYQYFEPILAKQNLLELFFDIEMPFMQLLLKMENYGMQVSINKFQGFLSKSTDNIEQLTAKIAKLAGVEFNINSTKQLGEVLFDHLKLTGAKKSFKSQNYKTDEKTLNKLLNEHPIINEILAYREEFKLLSTYIKPLLELAQANANAMIHSNFSQTGTATGRLSSNHPNLQNIPVKNLSSDIRTGFRARAGYQLISIDYSQIELRLLAHFSQDSYLVQAFANDADIHLETAKKIFGETEANTKRSIAKTVNFGLLYGMGARKLADTLQIKTPEAKLIIENYFAAFSSVRNYFDQVKHQARNQGFVETLLKRRRYFDYDSAGAKDQAIFDRTSVNTIFQGSAADLIKLSMLAIDQQYKAQDLKLLLQIHDELIFEVPTNSTEDLAQDLQAIMEDIYKLEVPLKCNINIGDNWGVLK